MATMNKTFSVKTGLDLANTIILDSNRNLSNVNIANLHTINANSIVTVEGLNVIDQANTARTTANDAYAQANTARGTANDAYAQANTARDTANGAYAQANGAYAQANGAYAQANGAFGQANGAYAQANGAYAQANGAYDQANTSANTVSVTVGGLTLNNKKLLLQNTNSMTIELLDDGTNANLVLRSSGGIAYDQANAAYAQANAARDQANTARGTANDSYAQANTARDTANDAYGQANTARTVANNAYGQANGAYAQANTARDTANDAYGQANTARTTANDAYAQANAGYAQANTARDTANDAYAQANTARTTANDAYGQANAAYGQANAAYGQANAAYGEANLKLNLTGGTVSGDLTVQGNLYLTGNATYINVATLKVNDSIIQLSTNSTSDALDIGFVGHYSEDGGTTNLHAGFIRHASDNVFYIFDGYGTEPSNNVIDIASANLAWLRANVNAASLLLNGNTVATQANLTIANDQANAAYGQANTARGTANDAYAQANAGYAQANTARGTANDAYAQANSGYAQANAAYGQANAAYNQANSGYSQANAAYSQANAAYADSNTRVLRSGDTMTGDLTVNAFINTNTVFVNKKTTVAAPNTAHQDGERLRLYDFNNPGQPNYAIGVEPNHIWTATDDNSGATGFKWYGNTAQAMFLKSNGDLFVSNTINAKAFVTSAGLNVTDHANNAYAEANAAANTVMVSANSGSSLTKKKLNFINSASIQVSVTDAGDGNANIVFNTTGAAVADAYAQANAAYGQANAAYGQANAAYEEANTKVETIVTGLGLSNSVATVANVTTVTITPNIASTSVIGVTKLVDSITSVDTANAATANAVNWLETKKVNRAGDTMTGKLTINAAGEGLEVANANVTNTLTVEALRVTTNTVTTAASGQVVLDVFPTTDLASAKYFVQANSGSTYHTTEIVLVQEGTNIWMTEYGSIQTGASLGTFSADIDSGNVRLLFNATQSINTIRAVRYGIMP